MILETPSPYSLIMHYDNSLADVLLVESAWTSEQN